MANKVLASSQVTILDLSDGVSIVSVDVEYAIHTSATQAPTSGWQTTSPKWESGKYIWSRTKTIYSHGEPTYSQPACITGAAGSDGKGIVSTTVTYQASSNGTSAPTGSWTSTIPTVAAGQYLWTKTVISYTDGSTSTSYSIGKMGEQGQKGNEGRGIKSTVIQYQVSTSGTTTPTGTWSSTVPTVNPGQYLWTKTTINYTDNSTPSVSYSVGRMGDDGRGIERVTNYYLATSASSGVTVNTSGWTETVQSVSSTNKYLWNYEKITYTNNSSTTTPPTIIGAYGKDGTDGKGISSIVEYYLVSTNATGVTTSTNGWSTTIPTMTVTNKYLWNYEVINYTTGSPTTSTPKVIGVYGATGATGATGPAGAAGRSVVSIVELYKKLNTKEQQTKPTSDSGWSTTPPVWEIGYYIHTCSKITYDKGTPLVEYTTPVCDSSWEAVNNIEIGARNLIVNKTLTKGSYLNSSGTVVSDTNWCYTDYIPVTPGIQVIAGGYVNLGNAPSTCYYNSSKTFVSGINNGNSVTSSTPDTMKNDKRRLVTIPANVAYMRFSFMQADIGKIKLEKGNKSTDWTPAPEDTVVKVETMYYHSTSLSSVTGGSWTTTLPTLAANKYIWTKTVTTYAAGNPSETTPILYQPDWIQEWGGTKTTINSTSVLSPKIFAGTKNSDNTVTGVSMGSNIFGSGADWSGIAGYQKGVKTFHFKTDGSLLIGKNTTDNHISWDGSTLSVAASSLKIGTTSAATTSDVNQAKKDAVVDAVGVKDTKDTNQNPQWYITNYPQRTVSEFKTVSVLNLPVTAGTYGTLVTTVPWSSTSGGLPVQTFTNDKMDTYERKATSTTAWGTWSRKVNETQDDVFNTLTKGATEKGIYLENKNLYINATMIKTGTLSADRIAANSISASKLTIGDLTNYCELNKDTYSLLKFNTVADSTQTNNPWFSPKTLARDTHLNLGTAYAQYNGQVAGTYRISFEVSSNVQAATTSGGSTIDYARINVGLYGKTNTGTTVYYIPTGVLSSSGAAATTCSVTTTIPSTVVSFSVYLQIAGYSPFSGTLKIRNVRVNKMTSGELIVNGAVNGHTIIGATIKNAETNPTFQVTSAGALTATNATIKGTVTATGGKIAGYTISGNDLIGTNVGISGASTNQAFWAGSATATSAPFRVTHAGALTATSATIKGTVTATGGKIAGFTISGDNLTATNVGMSGSTASGNIAFWAGHNTAASAPFQVTNQGKMLLGSKSSSYLEWTGSALNIKANSMSIGASNVATSTDVDNKIDQIEIGGANLQNNSDFKVDLSDWKVGTGYTMNEDILIDSLNTAKFERTGLTANAVSYLYSGNASIPAKEKDVFTASASFYCATGDSSKIDATVTLGIWYYNSSGNSVGSGKVDVKFTEGQWVKYTYTSTAPANTTCVAIVIAANRNGKFYVGKPKLEKGNKATDWCPSAEDVDKSISDTEAVINKNIDSAVKDVKDEVLKDVKENYTSSSDFQSFSSSVSSQFQQTSNDITASFNTVNTYAKEVEGKLQTFKDNFNTYIRFSNDGMEIGKSNSVFTTKLDNTKLAFCQNGEEVAYISNNKMVITTADIDDQLRIGDSTNGYFVWVQGSSGNLSLKWSDK